MKMTPQEMKKMFDDAFPGVVMNTRQLWALTLFAKHVRLRARNNSAFNNLMNAVFVHAKFKQVTKTKPDGSTYPGLEITALDQVHSMDEDI